MDQRATTVGGFGTGVSVDLFDPNNFQAGALDERWTVRAIRYRLAAVAVVSAAGTAPAAVLTTGVALQGRQEPSSDPSLPAATDQEADWLDLSSALISLPVGTNFFGGGEDAGFDTPFNRFIRAMRKVDMDQVIRLTVAQKGIDVANFTQSTITRFSIDVISSVLFQRTRR